MNERPLASACFSFILGIFLAGCSGIFAAAMMMAIGLVLLLLRNRKKELSVFLLLLIPFAVCAGLLYGAFAEAGREEKPQLSYHQPVQVTGKVYKREEKSSQTLLYLKVTSIQFLGESYLKNSEVNNLILYLTSHETILMGNTITVKGKLKSFERARNEGQFDAASYYDVQKIDFRLEGEEITILDPKCNRYLETLEFIKNKLADTFSAITGEKEASLLSAMILGDKSQLSMEVKEMYQKSGIMHILVISGLHISFMGMICYHLLRKSGLPFAVSGVISLVLIISYGVMTGLGVSTLRALIMFGLSIGAKVSGRTYDMATGTCFSAVLLLLENPLYLYQAGFLLSFGAIIGMGAVAPALKEGFPKELPFLGELWTNLGIHLAALPVLTWFFYEFPLYSLILNMLIIPLSTILLLSGMAGGMAGLLSIRLGIFLVAPCHYILGVYEKLCDFFLQLPGAVFITGRPGKWQIFMYYVILLGVLFLRKKRGKKRDLLMLTFCVFFLLFSGKEGLQVTALDVGQGDCIFIRTPANTTYMVDGGSSNVTDVGKYRIIPYLKYQGVKKLDYIVITHMDQDHISGIKEIIEESDEGGIRVGYLVLAGIEGKDEVYLELERLAGKNKVEILYIKSGDMLSENEVVIKCLHPEQNFKGSDRNNSSIVLSLSFSHFDMLLTGDIGDEAEKHLMKHQNLKDYDVLKVAHHGSEYSTSKEFLSVIKPEYSLISCGERNGYGHPHENLLDRLQENESQVFLTKYGGSITIRTDGNRITIHKYISEEKNQKE